MPFSKLYWHLLIPDFSITCNLVLKLIFIHVNYVCALLKWNACYYQQTTSNKSGISPSWFVDHTNLGLFVLVLLTCIFLNFIWRNSPPLGYGLLIHDVSRSHNDAPQLVGLLWTSDQPVAETSTWQHTTLKTDRHPCHRWDSNPQSQQASKRRPTP